MRPDSSDETSSAFVDAIARPSPRRRGPVVACLAVALLAVAGVAALVALGSDGDVADPRRVEAPSARPRGLDCSEQVGEDTDHGSGGGAATSEEAVLADLPDDAVTYFSYRRGRVETYWARDENGSVVFRADAVRQGGGWLVLSTARCA